MKKKISNKKVSKKKKIPDCGITIKDMRKILENSKVLDKTQSMLLNSKYNFREVDKKLVLDAFNEIENSIWIAQTGLEECSACVKLLFMILLEHCELKK